MEFYMQAEMQELVAHFEDAYFMAWDTCEEIQEYIRDHYEGNTEQFLSDVAHNCDYFSMSPILREFIDKIEKSNS